MRRNACRLLMDSTLLAQVAERDVTRDMRDVARRYLVMPTITEPEEIAQMQQEFGTRRRLRMSNVRLPTKRGPQTDATVG